MKKIDSELTGIAEKYVMNLLNKKLSPEYLFHSTRHTLNVAQNAAIIGENCGLTDDEMNLLRISALFHDTGYTLSNDNHESESAFIAGEFLRSNEIGEEDIEVVANAIMATQVPQRPNDLISNVLCDADLMHLASDDYFEQMELLRLEWQVTGKRFFTEYQFHMNSVEFFYAHHYHSDYGRTVLQEKKEQVLRLVIQKAESLAKT